MKNILCFGDSNTFGINPENGLRHPRAVRWPGRLQQLLGADYQIIEEGMGGRNTVWKDPLAIWRTGQDALPCALESHKPLDLVLFSLGTNDCRSYLSASAEVIAYGMEQLVQLVQCFDFRPGYPMPQIMLLSPIWLGADLSKYPVPFFDAASYEKSKQLAEPFRQVAERNHCAFFDAARVSQAGCDQIHMDASGHAALADALAQQIPGLFSI